MERAQESRERVERMGWKPRNVVWELTLACNLRCGHCGSSAGKARDDEMSLPESLDLADQLADLGAELVTLSGGEPTLKDGWDRIAARLSGRGVMTNMVTNGFYPGRDGAQEVARRALDAGMCNVGISIDGPESVHEMIRGKGTFAKTMAAIETFVAAGMKVGVLTTVNRLNFPYLEQVRALAMQAGATMWRLQLGKPMGELKEKESWVISPAQLMELVPWLARLKRAGGIHLAVGDSIGYYGRHDRVLRGRGWRGRKESWQGCQAGMQALGIEADGGIKGCLSLQARWGDEDPFREANVREASLADIWYRPGIFAFNRDFDAETLTGYCGQCRHARACRGGARCVSAAFMGHVNEDPYCTHRLAALLDGQQPGAGRTAAAAAAALVLSLGVSGCPISEPENDTTAVPPDATASDVYAEPDECCAPEYGVFPDLVVPEDRVVEPDVQLEYGMPPDLVEPADTVTEPDVQLEYGMPPDVQDVQYPPEVSLDYGIDPQDIVIQDTQPADTIDCEAVCCDCEYGVIPDDVWDKCCAEEDPCADVCCECDYGAPPPEGCCD